MVGRLLTALWRVALALAALKFLADLARDGHSALALTAVAVPIGIFILVGARRATTRVAPVAGPLDDQGAALFGQLSKRDQIRVTTLATSGNAIGAIKALRDLVNIDLRTAKDVVDQLAAPARD